MGQILPLDAASDRYRMTVILDGVEVGLKVYWLPRCAGWYLDIETPAGETLCAGVRITPDSEIAIPGAGEGIPPGRLVAIGPASYGHDDLGSQVKVMYLTETEVTT